MSSIEGLDFRCCQQTSVISAEVLSIHQTLNTVAADDRSSEVKQRGGRVLEATANETLLHDTAGEHLSIFCLKRTFTAALELT